MKEATTPCSIELQNNMQINRKFLEDQGWEIQNEYPLCDDYKHSKNKFLICSIGLYGHFCIYEKHWCNDESVREFSTINHKLSKEDYFKILELLAIKI